MIDNFSNYVPTGCKPIDECANIIACARERMMPIKEIILRPAYYEWFKSGLQTLMGKPLQLDQKMELDGVNIEKGTIYQTKMYVVNYYEPAVKAEA
jgi:hypothetical protein